MEIEVEDEENQEDDEKQEEEELNDEEGHIRELKGGT